jgi:hypothetical protein
MKKSIWKPWEDGQTHINVYSKGKTDLGQWLSNFAYSPFKHPKYGSFDSIEGFWYWLSTGMQYDKLRTLHGYLAKAQGKKYAIIEHPNFEQCIKTAIRAKLIANPDRLRQIIDNPLPLTHYYVYGDKAMHAGYEWITDYYQEIRRACIAKNYRP